MMRTIEILLTVSILFAAFMVVSYFAVLPSPRLVSSSNLRELAFSTLETLDANGELSKTAFASFSDPSWTNLQIALTASLPPNIVYNLTVYDIVTSANGVVTYHSARSFSNSQNDLGGGSDSSSHIVTSSNVTFTVTPQKIGESSGKNITLYILNCNDANGWWITGYTAQSLASDLRNLLFPYFQRTILVNTTAQLGQLLDNTTLKGERLRDAVVINTFGEAVPIPTSYADLYPDDSYAEYCYQLGKRVNQYNWTWISIVGWPFYYVTNTAKLSSSQNTWGIYGMKDVARKGLTAFLYGLDGRNYPSPPSDSQTGSPGVVYLSSNAQYYCNYYGIYPSTYQTSTRALPDSILSTYHLTATEIFNRPPSPNQNWIAGATYRHTGGGSLTAIGLARIADIRVTALGLLQFYHPSIYKSEYGAGGTSRLIVLQLSQQGGV
jgi:hypothetical protein